MGSRFQAFAQSSLHITTTPATRCWCRHDTGGRDLPLREESSERLVSRRHLHTQHSFGHEGARVLGTGRYMLLLKE